MAFLRIATLRTKPTAIKFDTMAVPPALTNGSGMPVTGISPIFIPMFSKK